MRKWFVAAASILVLAVAVIAWPSTPNTPTAAEINESVSSAVGRAIEDQQQQPARAAQVYQVIYPSLVVVQVERPGATGGRTGDSVPDDEGLGTGVFINADGAVLTALHVVEGASSIRLTFTDGTASDAEVISSDPSHDIAVLQPRALPEVVVPAVMGGGLNVGDETYAVGHPLGLAASLSAGVVSGLDRSIPLGDGRNLEGLIQFDAAVNPGSSGGPLLNRDGQVVGIVTALANPSQQGFFIGIGFAVPISTAGGAAGGPPQ
jgi:S1-C subfamily serine protease